MISAISPSETGASCPTWRPEDDDRATRSSHPPLSYPRNWKRQLPLQEQLGESCQTRKGETSKLDERLTPKPSSSRVSSQWKSRVKSQRKSTALFHQLLAQPVNHGWAGLQRFDDPTVAPAFPGFRDIGLQQDPRLQQPLRWALSFPDQGFKSLPLLRASTAPHTSLLKSPSPSRSPPPSAPSTKRIIKSLPID